MSGKEDSTAKASTFDGSEEFQQPPIEEACDEHFVDPGDQKTFQLSDCQYLLGKTSEILDFNVRFADKDVPSFEECNKGLTDYLMHRSFQECMGPERKPSAETDEALKLLKRYQKMADTFKDVNTWIFERATDIRSNLKNHESFLEKGIGNDGDTKSTENGGGDVSGDTKPKANGCADGDDKTKCDSGDAKSTAGGGVTFDTEVKTTYDNGATESTHGGDVKTTGGIGGAPTTPARKGKQQVPSTPQTLSSGIEGLAISTGTSTPMATLNPNTMPTPGGTKYNFATRAAGKRTIFTEILELHPDLVQIIMSADASNLHHVLTTYFKPSDNEWKLVAQAVRRQGSNLLPEYFSRGHYSARRTYGFNSCNDWGKAYAKEKRDFKYALLTFVCGGVVNFYFQPVGDDEAPVSFSL